MFDSILCHIEYLIPFLYRHFDKLFVFDSSEFDLLEIKFDLGLIVDFIEKNDMRLPYVLSANTNKKS